MVGVAMIAGISAGRRSAWQWVASAWEQLASGWKKGAGAPGEAALTRCKHVLERWAANHFGRYDMSIGTILLIIVVLLLIGAIPAWPHSRGWGYGPSGGLGLVLIILLILFLLGKL